ncbi:hypothetical protein M8494_14160 [Serratia ureilytica]
MKSGGLCGGGFDDPRGGRLFAGRRSFPIVGLHTAFIIGLVTALFGGKRAWFRRRRLHVVVLMSLAAQYGMGYVLWATLFAGAFKS